MGWFEIHSGLRAKSVSTSVMTSYRYTARRSIFSSQGQAMGLRSIPSSRTSRPASLISVPQRVVHAIVENVSYNELCFAIKISRSESGHGNFSSRYGLRVIIDIQDWTNQS